MMLPTSEAELVDLIRSSESALRLQGGGTRSLSDYGTALHLNGIAGVREYRPEAQTITAAAGTKLAELNEVLNTAGQRLAFEPPDYSSLLGRTGQSTIGGVIAENASGPRRILAGAARDALLGVRFIDGTGQAHRFGGPVMKNVSGFDVTTLMAGSRGRLGAITEVTLKTMPQPPEQITLALYDLDPATAINAMRLALSSPWEISGAAHQLNGPNGTSQTLFRLEGLTAQMQHRAPLLAKLLSQFGTVEHINDRDRSNALWAEIRDLRCFFAHEDDVWRISTTPAATLGLLEKSAPNEALIDWGGALLWLSVTPGTALRETLGAYPGHARLIRGTPHDEDDIHEAEPPALAALQRSLIARFDPQNRFQPARELA